MINIINKAIKPVKITLYILLFTSIVFSINIIDLSTHYFKGIINDNIINKIENRIIYVYNNSEVDKYKLLLSIDNVQYVYYNLEPKQIIIGNDKIIYMNYYNPLIDENFINLGHNEVIVSENFYYEYEKYIINDKFIAYIDDKNVELKIAGVTSNKQVNQGSEIYISSDNDINVDRNNEKYNNYIVLINNVKKIKSVENNIKSIGCKFQRINNSYINESNIYEGIVKILDIFFILLYLLLMIIIIILFLSNIIEQKYNIALMKTFGFSNLYIMLFFLINYIFLIFFSYFICILLLIIISIILSFFQIYNFINLTIILYNFTYNIVILIIIIIIMFLKIKNIEIIKMLKD